jgi:hypothetical protein
MGIKRVATGTGGRRVSTGESRENSGGLGGLSHERDNETKARGADGRFLSTRLKAMTGTDLEIVQPARTEIAGGDAERRPSLYTTADNDLDMLAVWIKSHADGSEHTRRALRAHRTALRRGAVPVGLRPSPRYHR